MDGNLLFILVAVIMFAAVAGVGVAFAGGGSERTNKRVAAVASTGRAERVRGGARVVTDTAGARRKQILQNLKTIERQERKAKLNIESRIAQAGLSVSVRNFWLGSLALGAVAFLVAFMAAHNALVGLGAGFALGFGLPRWALTFATKARYKKFTAEFPNSVDVIVRGIKSGLPLHDCVKVIAAESPEPLATEFRKLVENLGMGMTLDQALEKMYARMSTPELRFFTIVLAIQQKSGGNLAEALGNLSVVLRARALMREKVKALSGEAVASAVIIGCLPPGIIAMITATTPSYMAPMWTDPRGQMMLMIGAGLMAVGAFIMRRMINFKF